MEQNQPSPTLMAGRRGVVVGIANNRSLASGIARQARAAGAELIVTYQSERLARNVEPIAAELGARACLRCDLSSPSDIASLADTVREKFGGLDFLVHAVAFARREDLTGRFIDTSQEGFSEALQASCYSLTALCRGLLPLLEHGRHPSVLTLTYLGAERALPNYNVMGVAKAALEASVRYLAQDLGPAGIRVNALSAGPVKTLSAAAIGGLRHMLEAVERGAPLRRNIDLDDVGRTATTLLSEFTSGVTGEIIHVDSGFHAVGGPPVGS